MNNNNDNKKVATTTVNNNDNQCINNTLETYIYMIYCSINDTIRTYNN